MNQHALIKSGKRKETFTRDNNLENVYNADETGLFFRLGPNRTLATRNDKAKGIKKDKERVTVLLCCNATGTKKLKPFVIGKFKNPRCFKNVNLATLPVRYSNNKNAWMTMEKWNEWLKWLDNNVSEKSLLLVDNCPAHTDSFSLNLKNLRIEYIFHQILHRTYNLATRGLFVILRLTIEIFWCLNGFTN